jgi:RNA polymerase sigma-70 factor (sigma-E family)
VTDEGTIERRSAQALLRAAFEQHYLPLLRLCVLLSGNLPEAEDTVQEAFVRIAPRIEGLDQEGVGPYLRTTAVNVWKNRRRRRAAEIRARARQGVARPASTASLEEEDEVWTAVVRLPARRRACVVLRYYEDLPEQEVAAILGCSVGTVKSQTSRALTRLREELQRGR